MSYGKHLIYSFPPIYKVQYIYIHTSHHVPKVLVLGNWAIVEPFKHTRTHTHTHTHTHLVAEVHLALEFVDGALQGDLTLLSKRSKALHPTYGYKLETAYANRGVRKLGRQGIRGPGNRRSYRPGWFVIKNSKRLKGPWAGWPE